MIWTEFWKDKETTDIKQIICITQQNNLPKLSFYLSVHFLIPTIPSIPTIPTIPTTPTAWAFSKQYLYCWCWKEIVGSVDVGRELYVL